MRHCTIIALAAAAVACAPAACDAEQPSYSGIYPHLAVTNNGGNESGIGAVVPWADRLWFLTYPAHKFSGSDDKLYSLRALGAAEGRRRLHGHRPVPLQHARGVAGRGRHRSRNE
jgi:hypothetical protein